MNEEPKRKFSLFPKSLEQCIEPVVRPALKTQGLAGSRLLTQWASIVGPELARHCLPEKLSFPPGKTVNGTLTISVESGFATELQHLQPVLLERLAIYFGYAAVSRIAIAHSWQQALPEKLTPTKPLLKEDARNLADGVEDEELRAALQSLATTLSGGTTI